MVAVPGIRPEFEDGKYRLCLDLMKKPLPTALEEEKIIARIEAERKNRISGWQKGDVLVPPAVWHHMLDLIYTGHPKEAWDFLERMMPNVKNARVEFRADFLRRLRESPYWDVIKENLGE